MSCSDSVLSGKRLTVIIPIFNVEKYLHRCVDSVINQTYENLEIVLVNDGSTDGCGLICDEYAEKDIRVKVIHKENGGLSSARNSGLELISGEYVAFLDSDDWADAEMYKTLVEMLEKNNADIASCTFKEIYNSQVIINICTDETVLYNRESAIRSLLSESNNIRFEVWNKVFRKKLIEDVKFKEKQVFEDVYFDRIVFLKAKLFVHIDKPMHNYLKEREGNTNSYFNEKKLQVFKEFNDFIEELKSLNMIDLSKQMEAYALEFCISLYSDAYRLSVSEDIKKRLREVFFDYHYRSKKNAYVNKVKSILFLISPVLFIWVSSFKKRVP